MSSLSRLLEEVVAMLWESLSSSSVLSESCLDKRAILDFQPNMRTPNEFSALLRKIKDVKLYILPSLL